MTKVFSDVYDIMHPTPVSLEELAAMAVSLELWRCEINKHRNSDTLSDFQPSCDCISLKTMFPDLPSPITNVIQKYVTRFALSLKRWLTIHFVKVYHMHYYETQILSEFDDFVFDYNGTIHYERTAKRIMDSDTFSQVVKFEIACMYFFEDDIRRLWPYGCGKVDSMYKHIIARRNIELLYWIRCIAYHHLEIVSTIQRNSIYENMLSRCMTNYYDRQSVEYFWDRIPSERRMRIAMSSFHQTKSFARFILPKLDEQQLAEFINEKGVELMVLLLRDGSHDETFVLSTWMYIKNIMNVSQITDLAVYMLRSEVENLEDWSIENRLHLYFEILNNLPLNVMKLSIIRTILSNNNNVLVESINAGSGSWRTFEFLLGILSCVTVEERNVFWHNCWHLLIPRTRCKDLKRIMDICFENEDEIAQFKENIMAGNGILRDACVFLLGQRFFDELNGLVSFCYPDVGKARDFKQYLLQSVLLGESYCSGIEYVGVSEEFNEFVDDSYENADLSTDFKNKFMSLPAPVTVNL